MGPLPQFLESVKVKMNTIALTPHTRNNLNPSQKKPEPAHIQDIYLFKGFIYLFLDRGREGEREGQKHPCVVASCVPPTGDLAHNPGLCPDWESNRRPFNSQVGTQSTEPHQPGHRQDT